MPSSVKLLDTGDTEFMAEVFHGFGMAMLTGILCVFCILVLLFSNCPGVSSPGQLRYLLIYTTFAAICAT